LQDGTGHAKRRTSGGGGHHRIHAELPKSGARPTNDECPIKRSDNK
jgi:hypothetical protein